MSLKQYRMLDLFVMTILAVVFEFLNYFAAVAISGYRILFMSYTIVLSLIAIYRWDYRGVIVSIAGGITACLAYQAFDISQIIAYTIGNASVVLVALAFERGLKKERIVNNKILLVIYLFLAFVVVSFFRSLIIALFEINNFVSTLVDSLKQEIMFESLSFVISCIIILVAARKDGIMVEMVDYIRRTQEEDKLKIKDIKESPKFNSIRPFTEEGEMDDAYILDGGIPTRDQLKELDEYEKKQGGK